MIVFSKRIASIVILVFLLSLTVISFLPLPSSLNQIKHSYATAPTVVQSAYCRSNSPATSITGGTSHVSCNTPSYYQDFSTTVTSGDILVVGGEVSTPNNSAIAISDTQSNTWHMIVSSISLSGLGNQRLTEIWYTTASSTSSDTITLSDTSNSVYFAIWIQEVSGIISSGITHSSGSGTTTCCSVSSYSLQAYTFTVSDAVILTVGTWTATASFTKMYSNSGSEYETMAEYWLSSTGSSTTTMSMNQDASIAWTSSSATFQAGLTGCNPSTQICITLNDHADINAQALNAANYFTISISNGTTFHFYQNITGLVFGSSQTVTISNVTSGTSAFHDEFCWSRSSNECNTITFNTNSTDGSYTITRYYYEMYVGQLANYIIYNYKYSPSNFNQLGWTVPNLSYVTAPTSSTSTDSQLTVNIVPNTAILYGLRLTSPSTTPNILTNNTWNAYQSNTLTFSYNSGNAFSSSQPSSSITYIAEPVGNQKLPTMTAYASCVVFNAGNNYNYKTACGIPTSADVNGNIGCGNGFVTCVTPINSQTVSLGETVFWFNTEGQCGSHATPDGSLYIPVNVTDVQTIDGGTFCEGIIDPTTSTSYFVIVFQAPFTDGNNVMMYVMNGISILTSTTTISSTTENSQLVFHPITSGTLYFGLAESSGTGTPNKFDVNKPYTYLVGASGSPSPFNYAYYNSSYANSNQVLTSYTVNPFTTLGSTNTGAMVVWNPNSIIVNFSVSGLQSSYANVISINNVVYNINSLQPLLTYPAPSMITYGYYVTVSGSNWTSTTGTCSQTSKDASFTPTASCTITGVYSISTIDPNTQITITIGNELTAIISFLIPSFLIIFMFMIIGKKHMKLEGDAMIMIMILAVVVLTALGAIISQTFTPVWIGGITLIFMIGGFLYSKRR